MDVLGKEIEARLAAMFTALAAGDDVAPGPLLRTEGLMEAAVLLGAVSQAQLTAQMSACFEQVTGGSLEQMFGDDWLVLFPFPQIPILAKRAPVYPSTKD